MNSGRNRGRDRTARIVDGARPARAARAVPPSVGLRCRSGSRVAGRSRNHVPIPAAKSSGPLITNIPPGPSRSIAAPATKATTTNPAEPHARATPNRSRRPTIRTTRLSIIGAIPAVSAASRPSESPRVSASVEIASSPTTTAASVQATRTGPRTSPTPSAIEPHAGAANSPTSANQAISSPISRRSRPRDSR